MNNGQVVHHIVVCATAALLGCSAFAGLAGAAGQKTVPEGAAYEAQGDCSACHEKECSATAGLVSIEDHALLTCDICHTEEPVEINGGTHSSDDTQDSSEGNAKDVQDGAASTQRGSHEADPADAADEEQSPSIDEIHAAVEAGDAIPLRLKRTEPVDAVCFTCHGTYAELAKLTEDAEPLRDTEGNKVNPHEALSLTEKHDGTTCFSCHKAHVATDSRSSAESYCSLCHHAGVFECNTCHEE